MPMTQYLIRRHVENVCMEHLNDDSITYCGTCPFEDVIIDENPSLRDNFKRKRRIIEEQHDANRAQLRLKLK